jgi:tRNA nucleotidyltransferase (CCA-adding enzyme)
MADAEKHLSAHHRTMPIPDFPYRAEITRAAQEAGVTGYIVGGAVRDSLLGKANVDIDLTVDSDAVPFAQSLAVRYGGDITVHNAFRTTTWHVNAYDIDIATTRTETYEHPGALPTVSTPTSIERDLFRRDITINAMAIRLSDGALIDPYGGLRDLENGTIRVLHDGSFKDDPTRIFRAVRYEQRFGFRIEPHTLSLIKPALPLIPALSGERIRHEFDLVLEERNVRQMLSRLEELGVLPALNIRGLQHDAWLECAIRARQTMFRTIFRNGGMLEIMLCRVDNLESVLKTWNVGKKQSEMVFAVQRAYRNMALLSDNSTRPSQVAHALGEVIGVNEIPMISIANTHTARENIRRYIDEWRDVQPQTNGNTLQAMGLRPSPLFGRLLAGLRDAILDGDVVSPDGERDWLERKLQELQS